MIALSIQIPFLKDIIILFGFSIGIVYLLQKLKLPSILGFIVTGILIGPNGLALVSAEDQVEVLAEIGVVLLLFVIGLELSIKQLMSIRKTVFVGGALQVFSIIIVVATVFYIMGFTIQQSVFIGFLFSLSSTAIVLRLLQDHNELSKPHGRNALGILIFQDIIVVPMMLVIPLLAGKSSNIGADLGGMLLKSVVVFIITWLLAKYVVPDFFRRVALTKNKELFLLTTITLCFAVAYLTARAGLSLALGALLAGLIISESDYNHQATSLVLPFKELFLSLFFISIGMMMDMRFFLNHALVIIIITLVIIAIKAILGAVAVKTLKNTNDTALLTGFALAQVGEFAFVLSRVGIDYHLIRAEHNQYFLSVSILSMIATPFVLMLIRKVVSKPKKQNVKVADQSIEEVSLDNHLIIVGYGVNGRNVARAARFTDIPYAILELNPALVDRAKADKEPVYYGDATDEHLLELLHIEQARAIVVSIADEVNTKKIIQAVRQITQSVYVIVRTRLVSDTDNLLALGADEVIPEEFETSIQIFSKTLSNFLIPESEIEYLTQMFREKNYELLSKKHVNSFIRPTQIPDIRVSCLKVKCDSGVIVGKTIAESNIRREYGINILAVNRASKTTHRIDEHQTIETDDLLYVSGDLDKIKQFRALIQ